MNSNLHNLIKHINLSYDDYGKEKYIKAAKIVLKDFAEEYLKLNKEDYKINVNKAGHGSSADVSLKTSSIYILLVPEKSSVLCQKHKEWKLVPQCRNNWFDLEYAFSTNVSDFLNAINKIMI